MGLTLDDMIQGVIILFFTYVLFFVARRFYNIMHWHVDIRRELIECDNVALGATVVGYYFGLLIALGGILSVGRQSWNDAVLDIVLFGFFATIMLNLASWIHDKIILRGIDNEQAIIGDHDMAIGFSEAGGHIAMGFIIYGAFAGPSHTLLLASIVCLIGQLFIVVLSKLYDLITPFNLRQALAEQNTGVGLAYAGFIIALGNMVRYGFQGVHSDFTQQLLHFGKFALFAVVFFPLIRLFSNMLLLPNIKMNAVLVARTGSHTSAGAIEAFSYIAASFLLAWIL